MNLQFGYNWPLDTSLRFEQGTGPGISPPYNLNISRRYT